MTFSFLDSSFRALTLYFEVVAGSALTPGVIARIQTFGDHINFHTHVHFLVTEGGVNEAGVLHLIPRLDDARLEEIFASDIYASSRWVVRIIEATTRPRTAC